MDTNSDALNPDNAPNDMRTTRRLPLHADVEFAQVERFAREWGCRSASEWLDDASKSRRMTIWEISPHLHLWYMKDAVAGCAYVQVASTDADSATQLLQKAEQEFPTYARDELLDAIEKARDSDSLGLALVRLSIACGTGFDEEAYDAISSELYNEYDDVSAMAIWAVSYAPYPEFRPDLEELQENGLSESIRQGARHAIECLDDPRKIHSFVASGP